MMSSLLKCIVPMVLKRSFSLSSVSRTAVTIDPEEVARFANVLKKEDRNKQVSEIMAVKSLVDKPAKTVGQLVSVEGFPLSAEAISTPPILGIAEELHDTRLAEISKQYKELAGMVKNLPSLDAAKSGKPQDQVKAAAQYYSQALTVLEKFKATETAFFKVVDEICNEKLHPYIGTREVVTNTNFGMAYEDMTEMPFPGVRFKENTPEILALREKEKGSWKDLTLEEKKTLYRASFRKTLAEEIEASKENNDFWYHIWMSLFVCMLSWFIFEYYLTVQNREYNYFKYLNSPIVAEIVAEEVALRSQSVAKYADKYDYENMRWK